MRRIRAGLLGLALALFLAFPAYAASVMIAPSGVTWDGLDVVVVQGQAQSIEYRFPESDPTWIPSGCAPLDAGERCTVASDEHPGEVVEVRATSADGSSDQFWVTLAVHVEPGRYFQAALDRIVAALENIEVTVTSIVTVTPTGAGYQHLEQAVDGLQNSGVFGQVNQVGSSVQDAISTVTNLPKPTGRPTVPNVGDTKTPCDPDALKRLELCLPLGWGDHGLVQSNELYMHMSIPDHVLKNAIAYDALWRAIDVMVWVGLAIWLINQLKPTPTT